MHANDSNAFHRRRSTSIRPGAVFQRRPLAHSIPGTASAFKASIHSNPYLASRCRTLKSQTAHLKEKFEELAASVEELQPDHSAMDWAASAGTVIYVPSLATRENEALRASLEPPEVRGPEGTAFPDSSQYSNRADNYFGFGKATNSSANTGYGQTQPQPQLQPDPCQLASRGFQGNAFAAQMAAQPGTAAESAFQAAWANSFPNPFLFGGPAGQSATLSDMGTSRTTRPLIQVTAPSVNQSGEPRHAYVEDETSEEPGRDGT
jgi:hypothetical protein